MPDARAGHARSDDFEQRWLLERHRATNGNYSVAPFIIAAWGGDPWPQADS